MNTNKEVEYIAEIAMLKSALGILNGNAEPKLSLINKLLEAHSRSNDECRYRIRDVERIEIVTLSPTKHRNVITYTPQITATKEVNVL